ncbi:MAG: YeeE/YedE family protein [Oxalobacter sp.]|nr:MAG: YeeE/YedE family protein [Oxalobacter sp.]
MKLNTKDGGWSPYVAGGLTGILAVLSAYATTIWMGKTNFLGASTTFVRAAGFIERFFSPSHVTTNLYFLKTKPVFDWQFLLIIGIFIGALIASLMDRSFKLESVPPAWRERFGSSITKRAIGAFFGGIVAMVGARLADGCPSGHGLSGMMQLSVSALVALALFFGVGILVANLVYRKKGRKL